MSLVCGQRKASLQTETGCSSSKKYRSFLSVPIGLSEGPKLLYANTKAQFEETPTLGKCNGKLADEVDNPISDKRLNGHVTNLEESKEKLFASMKYEINRLNTFKDKWPIDFVKPSDLAETGLFYLQTEDKVQCAFCRGIISDWEIGDEPLIEHSKNFSLCPFLLARDVGNIPMVSSSASQIQPTINLSNGLSCDSRTLSSAVSYKPQHISMADYEKRLRTFRGWPLTMLQPEEVAKAGFYYTAISDIVTCFFCDGSLGNWDIGDDPWTEHAKYFPKCAFIELSKGTDFENIQQTNQPMNNTSQRSTMNDTEMQNEHILKSQIVRKASEIFPEQLVAEFVIKKYNDNKTEFSSVQELCEELLEVKQENFKCKESLTPSLEVKEISVERTKKDALLCKICMDQEMGVVFLPCGHLLACQSCAEEMSICPLCRKLITSTVRTYMS